MSCSLLVVQEPSHVGYAAIVVSGGLALGLIIQLWFSHVRPEVGIKGKHRPMSD